MPGTARELKRVLSEAGVDTRDCFEKSDLEAKFRATIGAPGWVGGAAKEAAKEASTSSASTSEDRSEKATEGKDAARTNPLASWWSSLTSFNSWPSVQSAGQKFRDALGSLNEQTGFSAKLRRLRSSATQRAKLLDAKLELSTKWLPMLRRSLASFNQTPLGAVARFLLIGWFFWSGLAFAIIGYAIPLLFLTNLLAPDLLRGLLRAQMEKAAAAAAAAQGAAGRGGGPYGAGAAGRGGGPYGAGAAGRGGGPYGAGASSSRTQQQGGKRGGGGSSDVIDVEATVSDK